MQFKFTEYSTCHFCISTKLFNMHRYSGFNNDRTPTLRGKSGAR